MIVCAGSIFLDHVSKVEKLPKKPIKIISKMLERRLGGSAAVASFTAKKLGSKSEFIGRFGDDEVSKFYVFHVPTNRILRRGIIGYENAKLVSSKIRKQYGYRFNDIKFKIDRGQDKTKSSPSSTIQLYIISPPFLYFIKMSFIFSGSCFLYSRLSFRQIFLDLYASNAAL